MKVSQYEGSKQRSSGQRQVAHVPKSGEALGCVATTQQLMRGSYTTEFTDHLHEPRWVVPNLSLTVSRSVLATKSA